MKTVHDADAVLELNRRFHDQVEAWTYDFRMGVDHSPAAVARMIDELEGVLGDHLPGGHVLDVGAGTGNVAIKLALDGRFDRVTAVDISDGMLLQARTTAEALGVQVDTLRSEMIDLPFTDASVDCVVGCAILHHLPDPMGFMAEVARVLKPGAPFIFIGEPSTAAEQMTRVVKSPLHLAVRAARSVGLLEAPIWDHEAIDVHTFTPADIDQLTATFDAVRFAPAGLLEPVVDQGLLAPMVLIGKGASPLRRFAAATRRVLRAADTQVERVAPRGWLASVKFAGRRPAASAQPEPPTAALAA